jgi:hypothetical protein
LKGRESRDGKERSVEFFTYTFIRECQDFQASKFLAFQGGSSGAEDICEYGQALDAMRLFFDDRIRVLWVESFRFWQA